MGAGLMSAWGKSWGAAWGKSWGVIEILRWVGIRIPLKIVNTLKIQLKQ